MLHWALCRLWEAFCSLRERWCDFTAVIFPSLLKTHQKRRIDINFSPPTLARPKHLSSVAILDLTLSWPYQVTWLAPRSSVGVSQIVPCSRAKHSITEQETNLAAADPYWHGSVGLGVLDMQHLPLAMTPTWVSLITHPPVRCNESDLPSGG